MKKYILVVDCPSNNAGRFSTRVHSTLKFSAPSVYGTKMQKASIFSRSHKGKAVHLVSQIHKIQA